MNDQSIVKMVRKNPSLGHWHRLFSWSLSKLAKPQCLIRLCHNSALHCQRSPADLEMRLHCDERVCNGYWAEPCFIYCRLADFVTIKESDFVWMHCTVIKSCFTLKWAYDMWNKPAYLGTLTGTTDGCMKHL